MLGSCFIVAFVGTTDSKRAIEFYRDRLGLRLVSQDQFAAVFDVNGTMLRVTAVRQLTPAPYTVLGWQVADIGEVVGDFRRRGIEPLRFDFVEQDASGIWTAPGGAKIAWFHDPDRNVLSLTQF
jgi:catechol 2,3-dioxygenase-like lactoylglutathione lyase family enzyme